MDEEFDIVVGELDAPTCWRLLSRAGFGRVGFVHDGTVMVLPVNTAVVDETIVFRTADATMLAAAGRGDGAPVAFECDDTDRIMESGWSVLVRGQLVDATARAQAGAWHELTVRPWLPGQRDRWMVIEPSCVSGRSVQRRRVLPRPSGLAVAPPG